MAFRKRLSIKGILKHQNSSTSTGKQSESFSEENDITKACSFCGISRNKVKGYCSICKLNLCKSCIKNHKKYYRTQKHTILDTCKILTDKERDVEDGALGRKKSSERNKNVFAEKCEKHPEKYVEFCTVKHKACEVVYIPDLIDGFEETKDFGDFYKEIGYLCFVLEQEKEKYTESRTVVNKSSAESLSAIRQHREKVNKYFDELEETVQVKNEEKKNASLKILQELEERNGLLLETLKNLKRDLNEKESGGYTCQLFVTMKNSNETMKVVREGTENLTKEKIASYVYVQDTEMVRFMKHIQHFGHLVELTGKRAKVVSSHEAKVEGELDTIVGDVINIVGIQEDGWLKGELNNYIGLIPACDVEIQSEEKQDENLEVTLLYERKCDELLSMSTDSGTPVEHSSDEIN